MNSMQFMILENNFCTVIILHGVCGCCFVFTLNYLHYLHCSACCRNVGHIHDASTVARSGLLQAIGTSNRTPHFVHWGVYCSSFTCHASSGCPSYTPPNSTLQDFGRHCSSQVLNSQVLIQWLGPQRVSEFDTWLLHRWTKTWRVESNGNKWN